MRQRQAGQALLIVLLGMAVVLTIVLSILSTSVTDVKVTTTEESALRAFSAAEAGVERALITGGAATGNLENSSFNASISSYGQLDSTFVYPQDLASGDTATIWFVSHDAQENLTCAAGFPCFTGRTIKLCWGRAGTGAGSTTTPAIETAFYYANTPGNYGTIRIARATYDPNSSRTPTNAFAAADAGTCTVDGTTFAFQKTIDIGALVPPVPAGSYNSSNGLQMVRVRMLYNTNSAQPLAVDTTFAGNANFPSQAIRIESTGTSGEATRKVEVLKNYADLPPVFDAVVFSPPGIVK